MSVRTADQVRIHEFLRDPIYRKWFAKAPVLLPNQGHGQPWWLYVQKKEEGPWSRAGVESYAKAYEWVGKHLSTIYDFAITSKRRTYLPPVYRPVLPNGKRAAQKVYWSEYPLSHNWCPYCRRPVVFRYFERHHADTQYRTFLGPAQHRRCTICGIRDVAVQQWLNLGR